MYTFFLLVTSLPSQTLSLSVASNPFQAQTLSSFFLSQLFCAVFVIMSSWFSVPVLESCMVWHLKCLLFHYAICCQQVCFSVVSCIWTCSFRMKCHKTRGFFEGIKNTSWSFSWLVTVVLARKWFPTPTVLQWDDESAICVLIAAWMGKISVSSQNPSAVFCCLKHLMFVLTCNASTI